MQSNGAGRGFGNSNPTHNSSVPPDTGSRRTVPGESHASARRSSPRRTKQTGIAAGAAVMVRLLETDHLDDQMAGAEQLAAQRIQTISVRIAHVLASANCGVKKPERGSTRIHRDMDLEPLRENAAFRELMKPKG